MRPSGSGLQNFLDQGNFSTRGDDYPSMDCSQIRFALSAALDGEDPGLPNLVVDTHLDGCASCRTWSAEVADFHRSLRVGPAAIEVDRTDAILTALPRRGVIPGRDDRTRSLQWVTVFVAIVQLAGAIPMLLGHGDEMHGHFARHIGVFTAAMAIGLLVVARRPDRARAILPMLAVLVAGLVWSCLDDLLSGRPVPGSAIAHGLDVAALGVVWLLAHTKGAGVTGERRPVLR